MATSSTINNRSLLDPVASSPSLSCILRLLRRTLLTGLLIGFIWLPGLSSGQAFAAANVTVMPAEMASKIVNSAATEGDRMSALVACLPKQLSQPSLKRAWSEMGNDQLERLLNLKASPKLSQAEIELKSCMNRKGFTS